MTEHSSRPERRGDVSGMFDGYDSCSEDTSSSSSSEESEEEVAPLPSNLPIIKNNGQVYTYPDGKSGMATCEMCGMVGVRDAFYSKTKRFCSVSCSRSYSSNSKKASILARLQVTVQKPSCSIICVSGPSPYLSSDAGSLLHPCPAGQ